MRFRRVRLPSIISGPWPAISAHGSVVTARFVGSALRPTADRSLAAIPAEYPEAGRGEALRVRLKEEEF